MTATIRTIREIAVGVYDGPHATPELHDEGAAVFLGIPNLLPDGRIDVSAARWVSERDLPKWNRRVTPQSKDIVFTYEATLNRYAIIPDDFPCCLGRRTALIRPDPAEVDHRFLFYYFFSPRWRMQIDEKTLTGATVDRIPLTTFPDFEVLLPELAEQRRVAEVLSAYDELIANNQRRVDLLEDAARRLYREWFVHLRFPGHELVQLNDRLPAGWRRMNMGDVCQSVGGGTPSTSRPEYWDGDVIWVTPTDVTRNDCLVLLDSEKKITDVGLSNSSAKLVPPETILMTSRASIGFFALIDRPACTNQGFISVVPNEVDSRMYLLFNLLSRVEEMVNLSTGATFKELSKKTFRSLTITWPTAEVLARFEQQCYPMIQQTRTLKTQNARLTRARDLLLPKLMSGKLDVSSIRLPEEAPT